MEPQAAISTLFRNVGYLYTRLPVITKNDHLYECNLTVWSSYLSRDYTAVTYKEETSHANIPSSPIAERH